jgi:flagellar basal-body rod protein FlgG
MDTGLYHAVGAMRAGENRLEAIAHNLANVSTRGYKRQTSFSRILEGRSPGRQQLVAGVSFDPAQGQLETTGDPMDLALEGRGFFAIETAQGRAYTRDGSFRVDDRGSLVTQDGQRVAWKGARGAVRPAGEAVRVDSDGRVRQGERVVGQLDLVDFEDPSRLVPVQEGRWLAPADARETPSKAQVRQGSVERSNVEAMDELVALITVQRGFESAASTLRTIEESYRRLNQQR